MNETLDAAGRPVVAREVDERPTAASGLRVFQFLSAAGGAVLFLMGLIAVFRVDFNAKLLDTSADVFGFGFSATAAIAGILLGGAILAAALAYQDRGGAAFIGLLTMALGIAALVIDGQANADVDVNSRTVGLFIAIGAVVFVCSLVPWWSRRRETTVVR